MSPSEQWSNSVPVPVPADPWNSPDAESAGPDYSVEANVSPSFAKTSVLNSEPLDVEKLEVATTKKRFKVNVVIISNNRLPPLRRLCSSLLASHDHERLEMSLTFNLEASSSHELVNFAERFEWGRGYKTVRKRILQGGLIRAVTEAWLKKHKFNYHHLLMGKPRGGNYHWIDNHMVRATKFNGKFTDLVKVMKEIEVFKR